MKRIFLLFFCSISLIGTAQSTLNIGTTTVEVDTIITGLDVPWEIIYGPDSHIWTTERKGIVSRINPMTGSKTVILNHVSQVKQNAESGMLGMALHPNFSVTPEVFIAYTYDDAGSTKERIVKFTYDGTNLIDEVTLLNNIQGNSTHVGARLFILPDNTLLVSTGDAQATSTPQNLNSTSGKILRMNLDGSIPSDNPNPASYVYSFGHRNTQGIAAGPTGIIYLSEHGASNDDEFQILEANRNYGWPNVEGFCDTPAEITFCNANNVKEPLITWTPTIATSDLMYYENEMFPEFHQKMLMAVLKDKKLIALELNASGDGVVGQVHYLTNLFGRLRDLCVGPNKEIYLATNGNSWANTDPNTHSIIVLRPPSNLNTPSNGLESKIKTYPNPMTDVLRIEVSNELIGSSVQIMSILGNELFNSTIVNIQQDLQVQDLISGTYILKITTSDGKLLIKKLVK